ncbi:nicotinate-nicotinamide nucleotide adenylyltransferase [Lactococcus kimchii]|uniref:nicotinate-nicotinamide nucleotide adenylyltransferase n=1 Tax=Lactococcus sp. S-13 TaxID=2507158 RepID=UPI0010235C79|nr:nicotinate-nicotinamide nucleotide adenylyltransferase [Lactococcus sp. S-13]RZI49612.1 nicotinate-nicotinamide nucleotide adenylyltransferase [Lactococcus sp. S-13]
MAIELLTPFTKVELQTEEDEKRRAIGLFWGNFNPVHIGHLTIADQVRQQLHLEKVVFLPEHNTDGHVAAMLTAALEGHPGLEVDACRLKAKNGAGIYQTVLELREENPECDFYFIVGGDMISGLSQWEHIDELLTMMQFVGVRRLRYRAGTSYPIMWVDVPVMDVSGSLIREQLHRGVKPNFLLAPKVLDYILKEGLYV